VLFSIEDRQPTTAGAQTSWIAPSAVVLGDVLLGVDVSIWFNAVLRGDNERISVGARSNIQDGCILHTDIGSPLQIGEDVTVGHRAILHGCSIGAGTLVGMGAIVLNDAVIGKSCIIGAQALVPEGKIIPDNSIVMGVPGKVVGQVLAERAVALRGAATRYVLNWKRYSTGLVRLADI
jgi:carbonic anhydrase/acetyltransferase-like protein (isoleucine patch superfamily)